MAARRSLNRKSEPADPPAFSNARLRLTAYALDHDIELLFLDPPEHFDDAIVGLIHGFNQELVVLYDEDKVIAAMVKSGMDEDEAREFFGYNTIGAWLGEQTPRFLTLKVEDA